MPPAIAADPIDPAVVGPPVSDLPALDEAAAATAPATEASEQGQGMKVLTGALQMVQELTGHDVTQVAERVLTMDIDGDGKIGMVPIEQTPRESSAEELLGVELEPASAPSIAAPPVTT